MTTTYKPPDGYTPFCDNPLCDLHLMESAPETQVLKDNCIMKFYQHQINGKNLCAVCVTAVEIVK